MQENPNFEIKDEIKFWYTKKQHTSTQIYPVKRDKTVLAVD
jgi:hypothetical protein